MSCLPMFDSCCFCCNLKTGSKAIGILSIVTSTLTLVVNSIYLAAISIALDDNTIDTSTISPTVLTIVLVLIIIDIIVDVLHIVLAIFLLIGIRKEVPRYIKNYVTFKTVLLVATFILICINFVNLNVSYIITNILVLALHCYWTLSVYNYYRQLTAGGNDVQIAPGQY